MVLTRNALPLLMLALAGCTDSTRMAMGDVNSIIVVADSGLWAQVEDTVLTALQPRIFAVRDEPAFKLTHVSPHHPDWLELRRFRQVLVIGPPEAGWVDAALGGATVEPPAVVEANDVWARDQNVTTLVVPGTGSAAGVTAVLDSVRSLLLSRYRGWATRRMYLSGHHEALADTLRALGGFSLDMPRVYRWRRATDSVFLFLNDNPDASQLVRYLLVTWRPTGAGEPDVASALVWRDSVATRFYEWGQTTETDRLDTRRLTGPGTAGLEIRGVWAGTLEDFPQAGPFITRVVDCPDQSRRYLLDAWLYAPARDKYQYMIQLETLLDSFACGAA